MGIPAANLKPLEDAATGTPAGITYVSAAARVADALTQDLSACGLISWLIEASLHTRSNGSAAIKDLLDSTSLFPFRIMHVSAEYDNYPDTQGLRIVLKVVCFMS